MFIERDKKIDGSSEIQSGHDNIRRDREKIDFGKGARCIIEIKTENAYNEKCFASLYNSETGSAAVEQVAIPFIWYTKDSNRCIKESKQSSKDSKIGPTETDSNSGIGDNEKTSKVIIQVCSL